MRKIVAVICVLSLFLTLCGCNFLNAVRAGSAEYIVTSMAFSEQEGEIKVFIEAIVVNTENAETLKTRKVFEGSGKTVTAAVENAAYSLTQGIQYGHMAAIIFEDSLSAKNFNAVCGYCYSLEEITLSAVCFSSDDVLALLENEPLSSVAVGYDILSTLEQRTNEYGTRFTNKFYEVLSFKDEAAKTIVLPYFTAKDGLIFRGLAVYLSGKNVALLENEEMSCYFIARDLQDKGKILIEGEIFEIEACSTKRFLKDGRANLCINIKSKNLPKDTIKKYIETVFEASKMGGYDIFGIMADFSKQNPNFSSDRIIKKYKDTSIKVVFK